MSLKKPYDVAVVFGRFNLLHKGHLALFESMFEKAGLVVIGLSSNDENLPAKFRMKAIAKACEAAGIHYKVVIASQPFELFELVSNMEAGSVLTMFGEDQYKLGKAAQRVYGWDTDVIPRLTSSTAIRGLIDNEEWDVLARLVPSSIINDVINLRKLETNG
tara:strand:- start:418 stop:900 length:483 start_codon:yes stop_codon:yes gene_type:complete